MKSPEASEAEGRRPLRSWMSLYVRQDFIVEQVQAVADAEVVLQPRQAKLLARVLRDGELRAAGFLPTKQIADRFDGGVLVVEVGFKVQFHGFLLTGF